MPSKAVAPTSQILNFPFKVKWPHGKVVGPFTSLKIFKFCNDFKKKKKKTNHVVFHQQLHSPSRLQKLLPLWL
jgi:hypothetical protein